ncbi:MAG: ferritin [Rubrobacteridae bacterium]|nr:ferritin [Rubrobacteridae bacterium]
MQIFKCRVCGEPHIGAEKSGNCPFFGARADHIVQAQDWVEEELPQLSDVSRLNLEHALMMESNNLLFYECSEEVAMNAELGALFKALSRVEAQHASMIRKMLGIQDPQEKEDNRGRCHALEQMNATEAHDREKRAIDFYSQAAEAATEPRVNELFSTLVEIEKAHLELLSAAAFGKTNPLDSAA